MTNRLPRRHRRRRLAAVLLLPIFWACGEGVAPEQRSAPASESPAAAAPTNPASPAQPAPPADAAQAASLPTVVFLGDSLTAGYQLAESQAWPALLAERFAAEGLPFRAVNAGVSGDTSAGGLARLDWVLRAEPDVVVVELGANDALRGQELAATEANLRRILERLDDAGVAVLLVGLEIPPNYGPEYARQFSALYPRLAAEHGVPLVPFLLERVAAEPSLNLGDGIHPNARGHELVAETVAPHLSPLVEAAAAGEGAEAAATK
ncbi:MAG TPA: arylesterase [Thermoanaerobaculia bacterium]